MEPTRSQGSENVLKIKIFRRRFGNCRVGPVGTAHCTPDAKSPFGKIQAVSADSSDSIGFHPFNQGSIHTSLIDEIFQQHSYFIVCKCCNDSRIQLKAFFKATDYIVFTAPFPRTERSGCTNPSLSRVQTKHHFSERYRIESTFFSRSYIQIHEESSSIYCGSLLQVPPLLSSFL